MGYLGTKLNEALPQRQSACLTRIALNNSVNPINLINFQTTYPPSTPPKTASSPARGLYFSCRWRPVADTARHHPTRLPPAFAWPLPALPCPAARSPPPRRFPPPVSLSRHCRTPSRAAPAHPPRGGFCPAPCASGCPVRNR